MPHVVWDWNGTLPDDLAATLEAINEVMARFGASVVLVASTLHRQRLDSLGAPVARHLQDALEVLERSSAA